MGHLWIEVFRSVLVLQSVTVTVTLVSPLGPSLCITLIRWRVSMRENKEIDRQTDDKHTRTARGREGGREGARSASVCAREHTLLRRKRIRTMQMWRQVG